MRSLQDESAPQVSSAFVCSCMRTVHAARAYDMSCGARAHAYARHAHMPARRASLGWPRPCPGPRARRPAPAPLTRVRPCQPEVAVSCSGPSGRRVDHASIISHPHPPLPSSTPLSITFQVKSGLCSARSGSGVACTSSATRREDVWRWSGWTHVVCGTQRCKRHKNFP